jgi:membrane protein YdbS with pleckstrin-like domain
VRLLRSLRADDTFAGSLDPEYPQHAPDPYSGQGRTPERSPAGPSRPSEDAAADRPPSRVRRAGRRLANTRRRVLPLPDEVIDQFLGNGERMFYSDHPSFRSFMVENTLLFAGFLVLAVLCAVISINGSLMAGLVILLILSLVLLALVLRRLGDRYTSYVVTDTRIMRISGILSRRAHSIPWVRVTDLTIEQSLVGRLFGYATLHIESANEDSGLRDLEGVSDPMLFNQHVVDMVIAKQGAAEPEWVKRGELPPVAMSRGLRRVRMLRRRRAEGEEPAVAVPSEPARREPGRRRQVQVGDPTARPLPEESEGDEESEALDPETLAAQLRSSGETDLRWRP